jgi:hypothetical protein
MTIKIEKTDRTGQAATAAAERKPTPYEPPRVTRKRSLERITLASGTIAPGGVIGGD